MNIFKLALELFVLYILYKVIFDFIIPIYRTTKQMKGKVQEMQDKMNQQANQYNRPPQTTATTATPKSNEDYIEYEEIK